MTQYERDGNFYEDMEPRNPCIHGIEMDEFCCECDEDDFVLELPQRDRG